MKYLVFTLFLSVSACSAAPSSAPAHPLFVGAWTGTQTTTVTCLGSASTTTGKLWAVTFDELPEGVTFSSSPDLVDVVAACTFDFAVSGDVARLEGAPLVCLAGNDLVTYTAISLTSDGAHLSGVVTATVTTGPTTCAVSQSIEATR